MARGCRRHVLWSVLLVLVGTAASTRLSAQCTSGTSVAQFRCWEQQITSSIDFYNNGAGNPYRDLILRVRFSGPGGVTFDQDAFWVGDTTNSTTARAFRVRTALVRGAWTWSVVGCSGSTGGQSCASGVTWTPASGSITVQASTGTNVLYNRGFPTQSARIVPPNNVSYLPISYGDRVTRFYWAGDTAWSAPAFEIDAQLYGGARHWTTYLSRRTPIGAPPPGQNRFAATAVLVAPAAHWSKANAADVFRTRPGCTVSPAVGSQPWNNALWYPNNCSFPNRAYWDAFDGLVQQATAADIVLLIAGLIHPLNLGTNPPYPTYSPPADVASFSRYLAARMAGFAVMFSPGFDMPTSAIAADGASSGLTLMGASGTAVRAASPRSLVTGHLNGAALCSDYRSLALSTPMTWHLFQSGHALAAQGPSSDPCAGWQGTAYETRVHAAIRRAIGMPTTLAGYTAPSMPNVNGEGPYDDPNVSPADYTQVNTRFRVRQAGNLSSLSGAQGFTYGLFPLTLWSNPAAAGTRDSERDMNALSARFRPYPGLASRAAWIVNNPTPFDQKRALASDGSSIAIAYVPNQTPANPQPPQASFSLSTSGLPGLGCSGLWTLRWSDPTGRRPSQPVAGCTGTTQMTVTAPLCTLTNHVVNEAPECDWILTLTRSASRASLGTPSEGTPPLPGKLDVWSERKEADEIEESSAILAQLTAAPLEPPIVVSPSGLATQDRPRVAAIPAGYVVVWHAEPLDGSLLGVFAQRLDAAGHLVGDPFRVNAITEHDQRDPAIAADPNGRSVVVWGSYDQDGDLGGIFGQLVDKEGNLVGGEFPINATVAGHQAAPEVVYLKDGGFAVGWTTEAIGDDLGAVSLRVFDAAGVPRSGEVWVVGADNAHPRLADLEPTAAGGVSLRWFVQDDGQALITSYTQSFDSQGEALGGPTELQ